MDGFSHTDEKGRARMVDVSGKPISRRYALAKGFIRLSANTVDLGRKNAVEKGDVIQVSRVAGINTAKMASGIVPLCHPIPIEWINVEIEIMDDGLEAKCEARTTARTGIEMEALAGVVGALLCIYDMCKAIDKGMRIEKVELVEKRKEDA